MSTEKDIRLKQRAGTASEWKRGTGTLINKPVTLLENELGWEIDTGRCKLGDGSTKWTDLPYTTSVYRGTGKNSIEQELESIPGESLGITYFNFGDKNPNAAELDTSLKRITVRGAQGNYSVAFGGISTAIGDRAQAENEWCLAKGDDSHAEGDSTAALGYASHSEGYRTTAYGKFSHAEGQETVAEGQCSIANGYQTKATGVGSLATQFSNTSSGDYSTTLGANNIASGYASIAAGTSSQATMNSSLAIGKAVVASGEHSQAFGFSTKSEGAYSFSANNTNTASGNSSAAFGLLNTTSGTASFCSGGGNEASGQYSTALGDNTVASEDCALAFGQASQAKNQLSIAGGYQSIANAVGAIAIGQNNNATGIYSSAFGCHTSTSRLGGFVVGTYNKSDTTGTDVFEVGTGVNGNPYTTLAVEDKKVKINGQATISDDVSISGNLYTIGNQIIFSAQDVFTDAVIKNSYSVPATIKLNGDTIYLSQYVHTNILQADQFNCSYITSNGGDTYLGKDGIFRIGAIDYQPTFAFDENIKVKIPNIEGEVSLNGRIYLDECSPNEPGYVATVSDVNKAVNAVEITFWINIPWGSVYASSKQLFEIYDFSSKLMIVPEYFELMTLTSSTAIGYFVPVDTEKDISQNSKNYILKYDSSTQKLYAYTNATARSSEWYRISFVSNDKALMDSVQ